MRRRDFLKGAGGLGLVGGCVTLRDTAPTGNAVEHLSLRVADPEATVAWWVRNLGFTVTMRHPGGSAFIADRAGRIAFEIYGPDEDHPAPDYRKADVLQLHVGFTSDDVEADIRRLVAAGAELEIHNVTPGFEEAVLRDPSGLVIQLVKREKSILKAASGR